ncbi:MAG TPA: hypothetical protein VFQ48_07625, partial [Pseudonocardiaceae bacterium]|nr:hypothetical protein [Pseudonocardiaceae bacterium]
PPDQAADPFRRRPAAPQRPASSDDGIPPPLEPPDLAEPPEPDDPGLAPRFHAAQPARSAAQSPRPQAPPEDDEEALLAEAAGTDRDAGSSRHPDEVALELLAEQLGARPVDS